MTSTVGWDETRPNLLRITYTEPFVMQDVFDALDQIVILLDQREEPVPLLVDLTDVRRIPPSAVTSFRTLAWHRGMLHPNISQSVVVQNNSKVLAMLQLFTRLFTPFQIVTSLEEAYQIIERGPHPI